MSAERWTIRVLLILALFVAIPTPASADHHSVTFLDAATCSNNPDIQLIRVQLQKEGENLWNNCIEFSSSTGGSSIVRSDPPDVEDLIVRAGSEALGAIPGSDLHLEIPNGLFSSGQVCYEGRDGRLHPDGAECRDVRLCVPVTTIECGCDGLPGSGLELDACGICGGRPGAPYRQRLPTTAAEGW